MHSFERYCSNSPLRVSADAHDYRVVNPTHGASVSSRLKAELTTVDHTVLGNVVNSWYCPYLFSIEDNFSCYPTRSHSRGRSLYAYSVHGMLNKAVDLHAAVGSSRARRGVQG
ncbi:hypothetical protein MSAN_01578400 [Mycena sanguinolenta]|uniref:Uncharacterized protein n=1 Tax=Mycena sanguinolenta TaxID=230812 RepID=A0A8H7CXY2_9AGAR|nr:hypothetical protein MSAN_01578400 [Mycena sanguinolenta]